jgi:CheY-like chemotaxis protein
VPHKLLLADDSVTIQRVIELTFADEDVQVIAVGNGADAIERAQRDRPDIVLADVGMPERDGYEVAAFIKGTPALKHIPVVLLTGAFEPVDEGRARSVGCDGVLVKPFEPQLVISRVKDLLAGRQPSGMWSGGPVAQGPVRQATAPPAGDARPTVAPPASQSDTLEAYFDHLDAAFGGPAPDAASPGAATRSNDPFADWDPDLQGDPARPARVDAPLAFPSLAPAPPAAPLTSVPPGSATPRAAPPQALSPQTLSPQAVPPQAVTPAPVVPPPAPTAVQAAAPPRVPSLVDAFAALLSAEQKIGLTSSSATVPKSPTSSAAGGVAPAVSEQMIDEIARRVLARLSDESRPSILEVAERLVKEEIDRLKSIE